VNGLEEIREQNALAYARAHLDLSPAGAELHFAYRAPAYYGEEVRTSVRPSHLQRRQEERTRDGHRLRRPGMRRLCGGCILRRRRGLHVIELRRRTLRARSLRRSPDRRQRDGPGLRRRRLRTVRHEPRVSIERRLRFSPLDAGRIPSSLSRTASPKASAAA